MIETEQGLASAAIADAPRDPFDTLPLTEAVLAANRLESKFAELFPDDPAAVAIHNGISVGIASRRNKLIVSQERFNPDQSTSLMGEPHELVWLGNAEKMSHLSQEEAADICPATPIGMLYHNTVIAACMRHPWLALEGNLHDNVKKLIGEAVNEAQTLFVDRQPLEQNAGVRELTPVMGLAGELILISAAKPFVHQNKHLPEGKFSPELFGEFVDLLEWNRKTNALFLQRKVYDFGKWYTWLMAEHAYIEQRLQGLERASSEDPGPAISALSRLSISIASQPGN